MGGTALILLDTHVLIWLDQGDSQLGAEAVRQIQRAYESSIVAVSAISFWEVAMLIRKRRVTMPGTVHAWRKALIAAGIEELPLTGVLGVQAVELEQLHSDPADRFILATAKSAGASLVTADQRLLEWPNSLPRINARL